MPWLIVFAEVVCSPRFDFQAHMTPAMHHGVSLGPRSAEMASGCAEARVHPQQYDAFKASLGCIKTQNKEENKILKIVISSTQAFTNHSDPQETAVSN